ncbi:hypothetical protein WJX77_006344 [Trebouxia sp. C0004]
MPCQVEQGLLDLSDAQLEDMMLLRQLYVTRRHLLSVKRLELMAGAQEKMPHPLDSVTRMSELATHLQKNASEDHDLLYNMSRAFYCGVLSMKQAGEVMVHSHPKMPILEDMLNTFAAERGYPADCDLAYTTSLEAEWAAFWQYTQLVNPDVAPRHYHVPFCDRSHGNIFGKFQSIQSFQSIKPAVCEINHSFPAACFVLSSAVQWQPPGAVP